MSRQAAYTLALHHRPTDRLESACGLTSGFGGGLPTTHVCFWEVYP